MPKAQPILRQAFVHGNKSSYDPGSVPEDSIWKSRNAHADYAGVLRIRRGVDNICNLGAGPVQGAIYSFGSILEIWNQNLYKVDPTTGSNTLISTANLGTTNANQMVEMLHWTRSGAEIAYILPGDGIYETTGSAASLTVPYSPLAGEKTNLLSKTVALENPYIALALAASGSGSTFAAGSVYVANDFVTPQGRTTVGTSQSSITVTAGQDVTTQINLAPGCTGTGIYVGTAANPKLLGTIASDGTITYSGTATSGLSVVVNGNALSVTISAPASATGAAPQGTNTTVATQDPASGPAKCTFGIIRSSLSLRAALTCNPSSPNSVYLSSPLDMTYFPYDQIIQLPDDGDKIVGIDNFYEYIAIFRTRDVWMFKGSDLSDPAAELTLQQTGVGCIAGRTIKYIPNLGLTFLGEDNVYALEGYNGYGYVTRAKADPIGDDIRTDLLQAIQGTKDFSRVHAVYFDRQYHLVFPDSPQDEKVFRLNLQNQAGWYMDTGPLTTHFVIDYSYNLYAGAAATGSTYRFDDTKLLDDTQTIPFYVSFRRENLQPGPARIKRIFIYAMIKGRTVEEALTFFGNAFNQQFNQEIVEQTLVTTGTDQNLTVTVTVDGVSFDIKQFQIYVAKLTTLQQAQIEPVVTLEAIFHPHLMGSFAQIEIQGNTAGQDIAILGYAIDYANRGRLHGSRQGVTL